MPMRSLMLAPGIRALQLEPHLRARHVGVESVQADVRRVADRLEDVVDAHGSGCSGEKWLMRPWKLFGPGARGKLGLYPRRREGSRRGSHSRRCTGEAEARILDGSHGNGRICSSPGRDCDRRTVLSIHDIKVFDGPAERSLRSTERSGVIRSGFVPRNRAIALLRQGANQFAERITSACRARPAMISATSVSVVRGFISVTRSTRRPARLVAVIQPSPERL